MLAIIPVSPAAPASASSTLSAACFCASVITMRPAMLEEWMGREPSSLQTNKPFGSRRNAAAAAACSDGRWQGGEQIGGGHSAGGERWW